MDTDVSFPPMPLLTLGVAENPVPPRSRSVEAFAKCRSVLIFLPELTDEVLNCGGLVAALRNRGIRVDLAAVTDGCASHPLVDDIPPARLRHVRRGEIIVTAERLGIEARRIHHLEYLDGNLPQTDTAAFSELVASFGALIALCEPQVLCVPTVARRAPDYNSVLTAVRRAVEFPARPVRIVEYPLDVIDAGRECNTLACLP